MESVHYWTVCDPCDIFFLIRASSLWKECFAVSFSFGRSRIRNIAVSASKPIRRKRLSSSLWLNFAICCGSSSVEASTWNRAVVTASCLAEARTVNCNFMNFSFGVDKGTLSPFFKVLSFWIWLRTSWFFVDAVGSEIIRAAGKIWPSASLSLKPYLGEAQKPQATLRLERICPVARR